MERLSDNYYVEKTRLGESDCFAPLLERYSAQVFSLIIKIVGNREDAEELTQDVFVKAFHSLSSFREDCSFSTWIYRIAYNMAVSSTRRKKMEIMPIDENLISGFPDEPDGMLSGTVDSEERLVHLELALKQLTPEERAMIMFFYKDDKSMEEIAIITGLTETNVKTKIFRIRKKLFVLMKMMEQK
ncbi:MAG: RNA polymerase sigma factor [Tannerella sp.]|jgi:RNA polymerase sigma-70 factor (ECF subfamily)|nr:RNA polymerase sigma factor [Tannerella sp.]